MLTVNIQTLDHISSSICFSSDSYFDDFFFAVFAYSSEKCVDNKHKCSVFADCRDYSTGYCCHCRPGYYGNGKDCVPDGKKTLQTNFFSKSFLFE